MFSRTHEKGPRSAPVRRWCAGAWPLLAAAIAIPCLDPGTAHASCGLDVCPLDEAPAADPDEGSSTTGVYFPPLVRLSKFSRDDVEGHYLETILRGEYRGPGGWIVAVSLPVIHLMLDDTSRTGLGNGVVVGEWRLPVTSAVSVALGAQVELPIGDTEGGLAADHVELLPYGGVSWGGGPVRVHLTLGMRVGVGGDHMEEPEDIRDRFAPKHDGGDHGTPLYVNPHEQRELAYQGSIEAPLFGRRLLPAVCVSGQYVLGDDVETRSFLTAGAKLGSRLSARWEVFLQGEAPLVTPARVDWRTGLGVLYRL